MTEETRSGTVLWTVHLPRVTYRRFTWLAGLGWARLARNVPHPTQHKRLSSPAPPPTYLHEDGQQEWETSGGSHPRPRDDSGGRRETEPTRRSNPGLPPFPPSVTTRTLGNDRPRFEAWRFS